MAKVTIKLNGVLIGIIRMSVEDIRKAEHEGFTVDYAYVREAK